MRNIIYASNGIDLSVHLSQEGLITCLFLHGLGEGSYAWCDVIPNLDSVINSILIDFRGHGFSSWGNVNTYDIENYVKDTINLINYIDVRRFFIVGHSLGAAVALNVAAALPRRVAGVMLVERSLNIEPSADAEFCKSFHAQYKAYHSVDEFAEHLIKTRPLGQHDTLRRYATSALKQCASGEYILRADPGVMASSRVLNEDIKSLHRVDIPLMIVRGKLSAFLSIKGAQLLSGLSNLSSIRTVPRAGHAVLSENPFYIADIINEFIVSNARRQVSR